MRGDLKFMLSCGAAAAALLTGMGAAYAQEANDGGIEQIVVSAERRDESVQKVPSTIQAFSGSALADLNINTLDSLLKYTPNVTYGNNGPGQGEVIMRGLSNGFRGGQSSATIANFPNVAIYLDDQSMSFPARNVDIYMADMNRIEVLEGPQGTLFGGGAEAGALRYITNKPDLDTTSANVQAMYGVTSGGDPNSGVTGVFNIPIINDKLAVRVVIYDERQGGYIDNVPSDFTRSNEDLGNKGYFNILPTGGLCPNGKPAGAGGYCTLASSPTINNQQTAGKNFNPVEYNGARAELAYKVNDDWDLLISQSFDNLNSQGLSVEYPTGSDFQKLKPLQVTAFAPSYDKDRYENTAWTVNGHIGDLKVVYTGGYMVRNINNQMDYTNYSRSAGGMYYQCVGGGTGWGTGAPSCYSPLGYWNDTVKSTHQSHELRVSTPDDWRIRAIGGAYWENFTIYDDMNFNYKTIPACTPANLAAAQAGGPVCAADVGTLPGVTSNHPGTRSDSTAFGEDTQRGYEQTAFFGSVSYDIFSNLTITGGTRWYEYREYELGTQYQTGEDCQNVAPQCNGDAHNISADHDRKTYAGFKSNANLTWHVTDNTMAYFTFSQGFRPGAFNRKGGDVAPLVSKADGNEFQFDKPTSYRPDSLTNYEIGLKSTFFDDHLQLNVSAYDMLWRNIQMLFFNPSELGNTTFGVNGADYLVKGGELQFVALPFDGLTLQGSGSYNDATQENSPCLVNNVAGSAGYGTCITQIYQKGPNTTVPFENPFGAIGTTPAFSPKFQGNFRVRYDWLVGDYAMFVQGGASYTGGMYNQLATYTPGNGVVVPNTTFLRYLQPAYTTFDATFGIAMNKWTAQLFGENLTDSHASTFTSSAQFIKSEVPLRPRVIGVKLGYTF